MPQITAPGYSAIAGAVTGLVLWILQEYVFRTGVPEAVEGATLVLIPAALSGIASTLTKRQATPQPPPAPRSPPHGTLHAGAAADVGGRRYAPAAASPDPAACAARSARTSRSSSSTRAVSREM